MQNWFTNLLLLLAFLALVIINDIMPFLPGDDFLYQLKFPTDNYLGNQKILSFSDYFESCYNHYLNYNYRVLPHALLQLIFLFPVYLFNIINSLVFLSLPMLIIGAYPKIKAKNPVLVYFSILMFLWVFHIDIGWSYLWKTGSVNYSWFLLLQIYLFQALIKKGYSTYTFSSKDLLVSALICTSNENAVLSLFAIGVFLLLRDIRENKEKDNMLIASLAVLFAGGCAMIFSPSMQLRISAESSGTTLSIDHVQEYLKRVTYYLIRFAPLALLPLMFIKRKVKLDKNMALYVLCIAISFISMFLAPLFEARSALFPFVVFLMMVVQMTESHKGVNKAMFFSLIVISGLVYLHRYIQMDNLANLSKQNLSILEKSKGTQDTIFLNSFCIASSGGLLICDDVFDDERHFHNRTLAAAYDVSAVKLAEEHSQIKVLETARSEISSDDFINSYDRIYAKSNDSNKTYDVEAYRKPITDRDKERFVFKMSKQDSEETMIVIRGSGNQVYYRILDPIPLSMRLYFLDILEKDHDGIVIDNIKYFVNDVYFPDSYKYYVVSLYSKEKHRAIGVPWRIENPN